MEEKKYYTVKEFADRAGVSKQAIYQQLNGRLKKFVKLIDRVKVIDVAALEEYYNSTKAKVSVQDLTTESSILSNKVEMLSDMVELLKNQIEAKDEQLKDANKQIESLNRQLENIVKIFDQQQHLSMMEKQKTLPAAFNVEVSEQIDSEPIQAEPAAEPIKKKWFWQR